MEKDGLEPGTVSFQGNVVYVKLTMSWGWRNDGSGVGSTDCSSEDRALIPRTHMLAHHRL